MDTLCQISFSPNRLVRGNHFDSTRPIRRRYQITPDRDAHHLVESIWMRDSNVLRSSSRLPEATKKGMAKIQVGRVVSHTPRRRKLSRLVSKDSQREKTRSSRTDNMALLKSRYSDEMRVKIPWREGRGYGLICIRCVRGRDVGAEGLSWKGGACKWCRGRQEGNRIRGWWRRGPCRRCWRRSRCGEPG